MARDFYLRAFGQLYRWSGVFFCPFCRNRFSGYFIPKAPFVWRMFSAHAKKQLQIQHSSQNQGRCGAERISKRNKT